MAFLLSVSICILKMVAFCLSGCQGKEKEEKTQSKIHLKSRHREYLYPYTETEKGKTHKALLLLLGVVRLPLRHKYHLHFGKFLHIFMYL